MIAIKYPYCENMNNKCFCNDRLKQNLAKKMRKLYLRKDVSCTDGTEMLHSGKNEGLEILKFSLTPKSNVTVFL